MTPLITDDELFQITFGPTWAGGKTVQQRVAELKAAAGAWKAKYARAKHSLGADNAGGYRACAYDCERRAENLERNFANVL